MGKRRRGEGGGAVAAEEEEEEKVEEEEEQEETEEEEPEEKRRRRRNDQTQIISMIEKNASEQLNSPLQALLIIVFPQLFLLFWFRCGFPEPAWTQHREEIVQYWLDFHHCRVLFFSRRTIKLHRGYKRNCWLYAGRLLLLYSQEQ